jgi:hypothetical protein
VQTTPPTRTEPLVRLTAVLTDALAALGAAGESEAACRLAGDAYSVLRREHPAQAHRINARMHRLVRMPDTNKEHANGDD